MKKWSGYF